MKMRHMKMARSCYRASNAWCFLPRSVEELRRMLAFSDRWHEKFEAVRHG